MVSSPGNQAEGAETGLTPVTPTKPKLDWTTQVRAEHAFRLIDSILPFEACLYHQILPLALEGSRLKLGMVNLDDSTALDYVRRILSYMNCSLVPQTIASDVHHAVLSAYLNHTVSQKKAANSQTSVKRIAPNKETLLQQKSEAHLEAAQPPSNPLDRSNQPTLLVDSPEELNFQDFEVASPPVSPAVPTSAPPPDSGSDQVSAADNGHHPSFSEHASQQATFILKSDLPSAIAPPLHIPPPGDALPTLDVNAKHLSDPIEVLATLSPAELLQEVMGRVLLGGIGRLYLERQQHQGRILWSQNGVLQSVLEGLPVETLQGVINEFKTLTRIPLIPVQKPKQVEIERLYQKHRLLLRLRVMPGTHGEEATVQVLRGAALKFYQQQQLANLSRDALNIAQELQHKVNEIRVRTRFYPMLTADQLSILPALDKVIKSVEQQLDALKALQLVESEDEEE
ncbi:hypothetical protein K9N68_33210 [Kovacikia minuta CCNUW1]|uniref:ATPase, T2SS/T4P/T4SS family n=1 Tax=Kovacikia minuta TaxID=2931930 RepID=UPI001CCA8618|nr:hypothetical protein [Kovacikia minuta]UBF26306.1 hypothetical protein K9N68_33210 [Kovacikia minuta CCNUW1]